MAWAALAQSPPTLVWIDQSTKLTDDAVKAAVTQLQQQNAKPQHIVVLVHGFDVPREDSQQQFTAVAQRIQAQFAKVGQTVAILGVQWDSAADAGLLGMEEAYFNKVLQARATGRFGMRQILLALQQAFPGVPIDIMGHSMGCEVTAAALVPDLKFDEVTDKLGAFAPDQKVRANSFTMCGSDLDYDFAVKGGISGRPVDCNLVWMTMSPYVDKPKDGVLKLRALVRGKALGAVLPKFTEEEWIRGTQAQKLILDNVDIPKDHAYLDYYSDARLGRIVPALVYKANPKATKITPELQGIAEVMAAPNVKVLLVPYLDSPLLSTQVYAMCRLEQLLCGGPKHLASDYISDEAKKLKDQPKVVRKDCQDSPCQLMKQGLWPTETEFTRAGAPKWAENQ